MKFVDVVRFQVPENTAQIQAKIIGESDGPVQKAASFERPDQKIVGVESKDRMRILKAISTDSVDFVLPVLSDAKIDKSIAALAKKEGCAIALSASEIFLSGDIKRAVSRASKAVEILEHYNCPAIIASFAPEPVFSRDRGDLTGILEILGARHPDRWLSEAGKIVQRNSERSRRTNAGTLKGVI